MERSIQITNDQWDLSATLHYPARNDSNQRQERIPVVVICHGFVGNRIGEHRLFVKTARRLAREGFLVVRFDYAGCGESPGEYGATGLDALIEQTRFVLDYALEIEEVDRDRIILLGHSLGGAVALLAAARDRRVKTLVLWAAVAHPFNDIVKITGKSVYDHAVLERSADYAGYSFAPCYFESLARHQPMREAKQFAGDVLLIHGTSDDTIPVDYSFLYQKLFWTRQEGLCDKEIIFQADHAFSRSEHTEAALNKTSRWLQDTANRRKDWHHWTI